MNKNKLPLPKTFNEQLKILKNEHNLIIDNNTFNQQILKNVNYYVLKNYADSVGYISRESAKDKSYKYVKNIKLCDIYNLYTFDIKLKNIIIFAIGMIEKNLRCCISNFLTLKYHDSEMIRKKHYQKSEPLKIINKVHKRIKESIAKGQITDDLTIQFSNSGHIPLWVAIESFSFGELFCFYKNLNTSSDINLNDKTQIAKNFNLSSHMFQSFLYSIKFVRNICSHFNRLIGRKLMSLPKSSHKIFKINSDSCELFEFVMLIVYFLEHIDKKQLKFFKKRLQTLFSNYKKVLNVIDSSTKWNLIFVKK